MNQLRTRKASESGRSRPLLKVTGDVPKTTLEPQNNHHRNKNKIPKSIRYDLENALVGLCDVWFEDIKPHLLRNNIKVHVHPGDAEVAAGGDRVPPPPGGDRGQLPPGAPGCSHLDPGAAPDRPRRRTATSAGYCSTQPATLRVRSRKPHQPPFKLLTPVLSPATPLIPGNHRNSEVRLSSTLQPMMPYRRPQQPHPSKASVCSTAWSRPMRPSEVVSSTNSFMAPRVFRTNSTVPVVPLHRRTPVRKHCVHGQSRRRQSDSQVLVPSQIVPSLTMRDQSTQTTGPLLRSRSPKRSPVAPGMLQSSSPSKEQRTNSKSPARKLKSHLTVEQRKPKRQSLQHNAKPLSPLSPMQRTKSRALFLPAPGHQSLSVAPHISVSSAHTREMVYYHDEPLFNDDHFDETYDDILQMLYESPKREKQLTTLNVTVTPNKKPVVKKILPWR